MKKIERQSEAAMRERVKETKKIIEKDQKENEDKLKKDMLYKIKVYFERFPFLSDRIQKPRVNASIGELEEIIYLIRHEMDAKNSLANLTNYVLYGVMTLESVWGDGTQMTMVPEQYRINLKGMSRLFNAGVFASDLEPLLMELDIEYPNLGKRSLLMRTVETFSQMLLKVHLINSNPNAMKLLNLQNQQPVDVPDIEKETEDDKAQ